jgi:hypothetical protein
MKLFENRMLRRIFGPKRDEVRGNRRKLPSEELNDLYSPNFVLVIKPRRMTWTEHVACMGVRRGLYTILVGDVRESDHLEDPGVDGRIILTWIFRKWDVGHSKDLAGSR